MKSNSKTLHRRNALKSGFATAAVASATMFGLTPAPAVGEVGRWPKNRLSGNGKNQNDHPPTSSVKFCLNMSTIRGQKLTLPQQVEVAATAGYDAIEPWVPDLDNYVKEGGDLGELKKQIDDAGLTVESAIGFARWIGDDETERAAGLAQARADMKLLKSIGGKRIAAPPIGAAEPGPTLAVIAERYRALLEVGAEEGIIPQLELWGFSKSISRLGELAYVAAEAAHPDACVLPDFYHIYKGGSSFEGLSMIEASKIHVFHMNDYPANPTRAEISDKDRVYPGDGIAPLTDIVRKLLEHGFVGHFSLELFNPDYWKQDANKVAKTGLDKMKAIVTAAS